MVSMVERKGEEERRKRKGGKAENGEEGRYVEAREGMVGGRGERWWAGLNTIGVTG